MSSSLYHDEAWEANLEELKKYKRKNGHCLVPRHFATDCGKKLGTWVDDQRAKYSKGKLLQYRVDALNAIGFCWRVQRSWQQSFELLKQYKEKYGHCKVPFRHGMLGAWVSTQRYYYKKNKLSDNLIIKLNSIGFVWDATSDKHKGKKRDPSFFVESAQPTGVGAEHNRDEYGPNIRVTPNNRKKQHITESSSPAPHRCEATNCGGHVGEAKALLELEGLKDGKIAALDKVTVGGSDQRSEMETESLAPKHDEYDEHVKDDEFEEDDGQFADADDDLSDPEVFYCKSKEGVLDQGTHDAFLTGQQLPTGVKRCFPSPLNGLHQNGKTEEYGWAHSTECPAPKRPRHDDYDEYESSAAYFARKRTPFDTFSL